ETLFNLEGIVQVGVVDQAFPAHSSARLLKVHPHDDVERVRHFVSQLLQSLGVVLGFVHVMNGAGANDHHQAVILAVQNVVNGLPPCENSFERAIAQGQGFFNVGGSNQYFLGDDIKV